MAAVSNNIGGIYDLANLAQIALLAPKFMMFNTIKTIYNQLYKPTAPRGFDLHIDQAVKILLEKERVEPTNAIYRELIVKLSSFKVRKIDPLFIERFCLSKLSSRILEQYPVNIVEAFVLAYLLLNNPMHINTLYFQIGVSGLISPTIINGQRVQDVEAIAQFVLKSLQEAELISFSDQTWVELGDKFKLENN